MEKNRFKSHRLVLAALFLALGMILPFFTAQIPEIGSMLLPMHIPVLVCGFVCGNLMLCPPHKKKRLLRQPLFIKCNYFNVIARELEFPGLWGQPHKF